MLFSAPPGQYCVATTSLIPTEGGVDCPVGTYGHREGLTAESECTPCTAGYYCETTGKLWLETFVGFVFYTTL